jgi:HSP20 family molecular chaperone IbpA
MTALLPRLFGDVTEFFDMELTPRSHLIRVEDSLTDQQYTVRAEIPGLNPEKDVHVTIADNMLTIRAERKEEEKTASRSEFRYGSLRRTVRLPDNADTAAITATYDKGILDVTVPLSAEAPAVRQIPVTTTT